MDTRSDRHFHEAWKTLKEMRVDLTNRWKQCCVDHLRENPDATLSSKDSTYEEVLQIVLDSDFKGEGVLASHSLPADVGTYEERTIQGPVLLQIESVTNIGVPLEQRKIEVSRAAKEQRRKYRATQIANADADEEEEERARRNHISSSSDDECEEDSGGFRAYSRRMLKIALTDGRTDVEAIEYDSVPSLKHTSVGQKILVRNVRVLRGLMMLDSASAGVIGGNLYLDQEIKDEDAASPHGDPTIGATTSSKRASSSRGGSSSSSSSSSSSRGGSIRNRNPISTTSAASRRGGTYGRSGSCANDGVAVLDRTSSSSVARTSNVEVIDDVDIAEDSSEWSEDSDHEAFLNEITSMEEEHHTQRYETSTTSRSSSFRMTGSRAISEWGVSFAYVVSAIVYAARVRAP
eukprot:g3704.t1